MFKINWSSKAIENEGLRTLMILVEYVFLLCLGGTVYYGMECIWRGYSHPSMFLVGGLCFIFIGLINEILEWETPLWKQILIGDIIILILEFVSGCIVNLWLGWNVWDYSDVPFNVLGQICLPFAILWLPITLFAIVLDDYIKFFLYGGKKPSYRWK